MATVSLHSVECWQSVSTEYKLICKWKNVKREEETEKGDNNEAYCSDKGCETPAFHLMSIYQQTI